jgi:hypothetical protein
MGRRGPPHVRAAAEQACDALLYYRRGSGSDLSMLRAFVEVDRATMAPNASPRKSARMPACTHTRPCLSRGSGWRARSRRRRNGSGATLFPRVLFILDGTGPTGIDTRIRALHAAARDLAPSDFRRDVHVLDALLSGPGTVLTPGSADSLLAAYPGNQLRLFH